MIFRIPTYTKTRDFKFLWDRNQKSLERLCTKNQQDQDRKMPPDSLSGAQVRRLLAGSPFAFGLEYRARNTAME